MNAFEKTKTMRAAEWSVWTGVSALCAALLSLSACGPTPGTVDDATNSAATEEGTPLDGDIQDIDGKGSGVSISGTTVRIRLPADTSRLLPGPPLPLADGTACLSCHDSGDVAEFTSDPQGPNYEVTNEFCRECHSADYISSQPPMNAAAWQKVVKKMVDKFDPAAGASVRVDGQPEPYLNPEHQKLMVDYLVATYGQ